ncbi:uncharacterized protein MYCFIDRAFT_175104 [Pseudocercospora fijiensis CIRAD86]|uniref:Uncharacterized protein n=1 Tax=Pseudocercospora fijiensis (strain CIRAD86) TaxID=383855 RepID=M2Z1H6_PSEFD|nr:uncharacterized protein MYCFIDRAFT_175104 [Pseudocercospora fijiensis CIRAD86]EME83680.1 hypothetical protein MYCFIDRAFT_175104 [Pseudocercospora fijiensis CIRAD86]
MAEDHRQRVGPVDAEVAAVHCELNILSSISYQTSKSCRQSSIQPLMVFIDALAICKNKRRLEKGGRLGSFGNLGNTTPVLGPASLQLVIASQQGSTVRSCGLINDSSCSFYTMKKTHSPAEKHILHPNKYLLRFATCLSYRYPEINKLISEPQKPPNRNSTSSSNHITVSTLGRTRTIHGASERTQLYPLPPSPPLLSPNP